MFIARARLCARQIGGLLIGFIVEEGRKRSRSAQMTDGNEKITGVPCPDVPLLVPVPDAIRHVATTKAESTRPQEGCCAARGSLTTNDVKAFRHSACRTRSKINKPGRTRRGDLP